MKNLILGLVFGFCCAAQVTQLPAPSVAGGGSPASPSGSLQYNNAGSFGGSLATYDSSAKALIFPAAMAGSYQLVRPTSYLSHNGAFAFNWAEYTNAGSARRDDVFSMGWNLSTEVAGANMVALNFESYYNPGGGVHQSEVYFAVSDAVITVRPFGFVHDVVAHTIGTTFTGDTWLWSNQAGTTSYLSISGNNIRMFASTLDTGATAGSNFITSSNGNVSMLRMEADGSVGIGTSSGTNVKLGASSSSTVSIPGHATITGNATVVGNFVLTNYNVGRVPFVDTAGLLNDNAGLTFTKASGTLTVTVLRITGDYKSADGTIGVTGATCTAWKNGLCTSL